MLIITHACNLNCTYCYERFKGERSMSFETAKKCILAELGRVRASDDYRELEIQFMGGEPFMNFKLIRQVVEWLEEIDSDVPYVCFASSNGSLIHGEIATWLERHRKRMFVGLSYDGNSEMQSTNRGGEFVDVKWFIETWPSQGMHLTVSKETLPQLADGVMSLQRMGGRCTVALAQGVDWSVDDARVFRRELKRLADFYLAEDGYAPVEPLMTRSFASVGNRGKASRSCGTGRGMTTYDVDGTAYPCHMFTPLVMGERAQDMGRAAVCRNDDLVDEGCRGCSFDNWCPTCYGFNCSLRGDVRKRDHSWCKMIYAQAEVVSEFQLRYFHKRRQSITEGDAGQLVAALRVHEMFRTHRIFVPDLKGGE